MYTREIMGISGSILHEKVILLMKLKMKIKSGSSDSLSRIKLFISDSIYCHTF